MAEKIYYTIEKIKKSTQGRTFHIVSSGNTRFATMDINISEDESYKANKSTSEQKAKPESPK